MLRIKKRPYQFCLSGNTIHYQFFSEEAVYDKTVTFEIKVLFDYNQTGVPSPEVITLPLVPVDGYADIDLKDILHAQLEYGVPLITGTETDCSVAAKQSGVFYVQFRQITSAIADPPWTDSEKDFLVRIIKGGLPVLKFQGTNFWQNYFALTVETKFFTWQLSNRMAAVYERMYLCWFNTSDADQCQRFFKTGVHGWHGQHAANGGHCSQIPNWFYPGGRSAMEPARHRAGGRQIHLLLGTNGDGHD
jgi:hypothetical protein